MTVCDPSVNNPSSKTCANDSTGIRRCGAMNFDRLFRLTVLSSATWRNAPAPPQQVLRSLRYAREHNEHLWMFEKCVFDKHSTPEHFIT